MKLASLLKKKKPGFALVETLMALTMSGMVVGGIMHLFMTQPRLSEAQDTLHDMVQNARITVEVMTRELRMAGYNPVGASFDGITPDLTGLHIRADLDGNGDTDGSDEDIRYTYDAEKQQIVRADRAGQDVLAEHIQAFTVAYLDQRGTPTTVHANIRQIRLTVTASMAETSLYDATHRGPQTYTLTTLVHMRNVSSGKEPGRS